MKILLINPYLTYYKASIEKERPTLNEPLGLGYLASCLMKYGYEVSILDAVATGNNEMKDGDYFIFGMKKEDIKGEIKKFNPDVVGITSMYTLHAKAAHDTARFVKEVKDVPVIVGGSHASVFFSELLHDKNIDIVVIGEGEETFLDLVRHLEKGKSIKNVDGTAIKYKGKIKINKERLLIKNLDDIPFPARELMPMELYMNDWYRQRMAMRPPRANIVTSRGCTGRCPFCSIHSIWHHTWRGRSAENVVDEIEILVKKYGAKEIAFQDDNVSLDKNRMGRICDLIIKRKLNIRWCTPNGIAIWTLDEKLIDKMKKSGCYKLTFGIETACLEIQKFINKTHINLERAKEIIKYCNKKGIWTHSTFIIGFPYETREQIQQSIDYAMSTDLDMATFYMATPYPGTIMWDIYKKEGLLPPEEKILEWTTTPDTDPLNTKYLDGKEIQELRNKAHARFYADRRKKFLNPLRILRKVHSIEEFKYMLKLAGVSGTVMKELAEDKTIK